MSELSIKPTLFAAFHCHWVLVEFPTFLNKIIIKHLLCPNLMNLSRDLNLPKTGFN